MDNQASCFRFVDDADWNPQLECLLVVIPPNLGSAAELFSALESGLHLPGYFGRNWDALSDSLRDLHWIKERTVVLLHNDLPNLGPVDMTHYLSVLAEAAADWKPNESHEVVVIFPKSVQGEILCLSQSTAPTRDS